MSYMITSVDVGIELQQTRRQLTSTVGVAADDPSPRSYCFLRCTKIVNSPKSLSGKERM